MTQWLHDAQQNGIPEPDVLRQLPFGQAQLDTWWRDNLADPGSARDLLQRTTQGRVADAGRVVGAQLAARLTRFLFTLLALFFLLKEADALAAQLRRAATRAFGPHGERIGQQIIASVHGTVNGLVLIGLGEGLLLGLVYAIAGVPHPTLFGALTAVAALLLAAQGSVIWALGVLGAGMIVTFVADHFVRPVLIGRRHEAAFPLGAARHSRRHRGLGTARPLPRSRYHGDSHPALARMGQRTEQMSGGQGRDFDVAPADGDCVDDQSEYARSDGPVCLGLADSAHHYRACFEAQMRNRVFHQARIAGITFEGIISADGPYISSSTAGGVALGVSALRNFQPEALGSRHAPPSGWWVVKYHSEERIFLPDFNRAAIRELSDEFGLVLLVDGQTTPSDRVRQHYFFTSPAWDGLRQWVIKHPRIAKTEASCDPYLPGWYRRAIIEAQALAA